jgi:glycosyltransferase involved in cell wall biosynthesis
MDGYRFDRLYLSDAPPGSGGVDRRTVGRRALAVAARARRYDLLHVHGEMAGMLCLPALAATHSVATLHGLHLLRRTRGLAHRSAKLGLRAIVRCASATICVSSSELDETRAIVGKRGAERLRLVLNGIDPPAPSTPEERAAARARFGLEQSSLVGVFVGSLDPHKDPLLAVWATLELARRGRPIQLLVAGEGLLRSEIERLAACAAGGTIHVLGHQPDVRPVLAAGDFFVLPSHREGLSLALLEAMALGLVPVVSDAPANAEAVGEAGLVVQRGDLDGLASTLERLITSPDERAALGVSARTRVSATFHADAMAEATRAVFEEVLEKGSER